LLWQASFGRADFLILVLKVLGLNPNGITHRKYRETPINKGFLDVSYKEILFSFLEKFSKFEQQNRRKNGSKGENRRKIAAKSPQKNRVEIDAKKTR
jgi:hypothetical protein